MRTATEVQREAGQPPVITADTMHTQTTTAAYITGRGGHYVFTVKANQPGLFARCKALPLGEDPCGLGVDVGHGRRVRRTIKVAAAPVLLDFAGAVQVAQLRRTRTVAGKKTVEVVYIITSMPSTESSPMQIATRVQGHWGIENNLGRLSRSRLARFRELVAEAVDPQRG
jgi:predicted transposase YbfD/YdcC